MSLFKSGSKEGHVETTPVAEKPRRRGCVGFMKKWWWAILIVVVIVLLVVLLPIFLVALPNMIQKKVNDSVLTIDGISVTNTRASAVTVSINSTVTSSDSIHAVVDGFTAELYLEDKLPHTPFATLQMPETTTGVSVVNITQELTNAASQAYIDYNTWYMANESLRMTVKGETHVRVKGLKATKVNFEKTVTLTGLNGFKGLNVTSANISLIADDRGDNFHGFVNLPNPSILTLQIGNATFANLFNGSRIGTLYIDDMFLHPGMNNLSVRANISQVPVLKAVTTKPYCATGILPFQLIGESVVNNGQNLTYFSTGLSLETQTTEIDVGSALKEAMNATIAKCPA